MSSDWQTFEQQYNSRYRLVVRVRGPFVSKLKPATPDSPEVPSYTFFEVESSVWDMSTGKKIKDSVATESIITDDIEVAKSKGFSTANFWASTSF
ncbi:hypothetical protein IAE40_13435 [Pseudomonas sp. S44]|uniref:hypothetical protein n=1 Tax=Pseudomonas sp. S44 TaxID=2767450 RepID=UPI00190B1004|nr:hypothetical protein [Pseudomonas sp. S44]MBK0059642.1 hypothetical protein [Pseudomonas sp. S44]